MNLDYVYILYHYGLIQDIPYDNPGKLQVLCQFHDDSSPSMRVDECGYKCWACGASGNFLALVIRLEYINSAMVIDEWQAILMVAKVRKLPHSTINIQQIVDKKYTPQEELLFSKLFFESLGKPSWDKLTDNVFMDKGYLPETLSHFGMKVNVQSNYPWVIPIKQSGDFVGFVSRRQIDKVKPKYLYSSGFKAAHTVGGEIEKGDVLIVEGYSGIMRSYQNGWSNVGCIFGSHFSKYHADFIRKYARSVVIGTDNDMAGEKASKEIQSLLFDVPLYRFGFPGNHTDIGDMDKTTFNRGTHLISKLN